MLRTYSTRFFSPEKEGAEPAEGDEPEEGDEGAEPAEGDEPEEGDEGAEPAEGDEPEEGDEGAEPARKETRVQRLANEARKEREGRIAAEARLEESQKHKPSSGDNGEAGRVRAEKLSLMTPEEKRIFLLEEKNERLEQGQNLTQIQMADFRDEARYEAIAGTDTLKGKAYAKHKAWVEATLVNERQAGRNPSRELLIRIKLGDEALNAKPGKKAQKAKDDAAARAASAKGAASSARGDIGGGKSNDPNSLEALKSRIERSERQRGLR